MSNVSVMCVYNGICHLGECPIWNVEQQKLFWTDIYNRKIWVYDPTLNSSKIYWQGNLQVGGFAFTNKGDLVLCSDKGIYSLKTDADGTVIAEPTLLFDIPLAENEMFNDITVDPKGRIFAGTVKRPDFTDGTLYRLEKGKEPAAVLKNLRCSNGMTFSLDEKYFFHTDSNFKAITRYNYERVTGEISNPIVYFQGTSEMGAPDGITLDSEGYVWAAFWGEACVRRLDSNGRVTAEIKLPAKQPTSVMFGGKNLNDLYITTASENADDITTGFCENGVFFGGPLYKFCPQVSGRAEWLAGF